MLVQTADGKQFFFHSKQKKSYWQRPEELKDVNLPEIKAEPKDASRADTKHEGHAEEKDAMMDSGDDHGERPHAGNGHNGSSPAPHDASSAGVKRFADNDSDSARDKKARFQSDVPPPRAPEPPKVHAHAYMHVASS